MGGDRDKLQLCPVRALTRYLFHSSTVSISPTCSSQCQRGRNRCAWTCGNGKTKAAEIQPTYHHGKHQMIQNTCFLFMLGSPELAKGETKGCANMNNDDVAHETEHIADDATDVLTALSSEEDNSANGINK